MSHELFELFGMLGAGVGLTALVHRGCSPLRSVWRRAQPIRCRLDGPGRQPDSGFPSTTPSPRSAGPRPLEPTI